MPPGLQIGDRGVSRGVTMPRLRAFTGGAHSIVEIAIDYKVKRCGWDQPQPMRMANVIAAFNRRLRPLRALVMHDVAQCACSIGDAQIALCGARGEDWPRVGCHPMLQLHLWRLLDPLARHFTTRHLPVGGLRACFGNS